ncbi:MAG: sensor histidine kinase [Anaerolineae bacterium]
MTARYQRIAITLYISVVLAIILYILISKLDLGASANNIRPRPTPPSVMWMPLLGNGAIATILIFLEYLLTNKSLPNLPRNEAAVHLGLRLILVTAMIFLGRVPFAVYMLYPVLLFTCFTFGQNTAYGFAFVSTIIVAVFVAGLSPGLLPASGDINNLLVYLLGVLMVILMANVLLQERETNQQLKAYSTQVATLAATDERNRLARDIHDSLGHHLMASSIQLEKATLFLKRDLGKSATALDHAQRTIREALTEVRASVKALREQEDKFDLVPELHDLIKRMSHHNLAIDFNLSGDSSTYSTFIRMTLYRIVQEGLTNIHKHANATQATIDLIFDTDHASLKISDNGKGFEENNGAQSSNGRYGLQGIQERVALVGGQYKIESASQKGTVLTVITPQKNGLTEERNLN